jgi:hypothetical protein
VDVDALLAELDACVDEIKKCQQEIVDRTEDWAAQQWAQMLDDAWHGWVEDEHPSGKAKAKRIELPEDEAAAKVAALEADDEQRALVTPRPYNDDKMRKLVEAKASALHAMALLASPALEQRPAEHRIVYESGLDATCACGSVLSVYGRTQTMAGVLAEHVRRAARGGHG